MDELIKNREDAVAAVWNWVDLLEGEEWRGKSGGSDRAVAEAVALWATRRGGVVFRAGIEEIALEAGVGRNTARRSLKRLADAGLLVKAAPATPVRATTWRLRVKRGLVPLGESVGAGGCFGGLGADWTRWGGFGKCTALIWRRCVGGASATEIATEAGVHIQTVRKHLQRLRRFGLVRYESRQRRWYAVEVGDVAALCGTAGARERDWAAMLERREGRRSRRGAGKTSTTGQYSSSCADRS